MRRGNQKLIILLCLSVMPLLLAAQTSSRTMFRTIGWNLKADALFYQVGDEYKPLTIREGSLSGFAGVESGRQTLTIFRRGTAPETGEPVFIPDADVRLPPSNQFLLVFFGSPKSDRGYRAFAFNDSLDVVGNKDLLIANFSPIPLAFQINGADRFGLRVLESRVIKGKDGRHVEIQLAAFREGSWKAEYATKLRIRNGRRYMLFFKDTADQILGLDGMSPVVLAENIRVLESAIASSDPDQSTGHLSGGLVPFDPGSADSDQMPSLPQE